MFAATGGGIDLVQHSQLKPLIPRSKSLGKLAA